MKEISGGISSLIIIIGFAVATVKPIRVKFALWISKIAKTPHLMEQLSIIDTNIKELRGGVATINDKLTAHIAENSVDIKKVHMAMMTSVGCQIKEIYAYNITNKTLTGTEKRTIFDLYDAYIALGGNGYIKAIFEEMKVWPVSDGT